MTLPRIELGKTGIKLSHLVLGGFHQVEISSEVVQKVIDVCPFGEAHLVLALSLGYFRLMV
jgi:metal-dependent hydrolase (beta-lactamase superfamily II)